jgi:hypothetical protein
MKKGLLRWSKTALKRHLVEVLEEMLLPIRHFNQALVLLIEMQNRPWVWVPDTKETTVLERRLMSSLN